MIALPPGASAAERLAALDPEAREREIAAMPDELALGIDHDWPFWRRDPQRTPKGDWLVWLIMAGRGFGKTRAEAEWVRGIAGRLSTARIALVGATMHEARAVMVEGESGILAVCAADDAPKWEPSLGRLSWPNGAQAFVYSAAEPDSLRGPQHHAAWADEIAKWPAGEAVWDNLMLGLRRGARPQAVATTSPRPVPLVRRLLAEAGVKRTHGRTFDNRGHLPEAFVAGVTGLYGGTRFGRQELDGELIEDVVGALWTRDAIERGRGRAPEGLKRVVIGVDPPASAAGTRGILACGMGADGAAYVLGDASAGGLGPDGWARAVARAAECWSADLVVAETNQGGEMVASVLKGADCALPVKAVQARFGKGQRAEPIANLFAIGKAKFAGAFPELEDQLCGLTSGGGYEGPGRSPDRADAMVWAMIELTQGRPRGEPRIRRL